MLRPRQDGYMTLDIKELINKLIFRVWMHGHQEQYMHFQPVSMRTYTLVHTLACTMTKLNTWEKRSYSNHGDQIQNYNNLLGIEESTPIPTELMKMIYVPHYLQAAVGQHRVGERGQCSVWTYFSSVVYKGDNTCG